MTLGKLETSDLTDWSTVLPPPGLCQSEGGKEQGGCLLSQVLIHQTGGGQWV